MKTTGCPDASKETNCYSCCWHCCCVYLHDELGERCERPKIDDVRWLPTGDDYLLETGTIDLCWEMGPLIPSVVLIISVLMEFESRDKGDIKSDPTAKTGIEFAKGNLGAMIETNLLC